MTLFKNLIFRESMVDPAKRSLLEAHFQIGLYLKESFVPQAFLYFMNIPNSKIKRCVRHCLSRCVHLPSTSRSRSWDAAPPSFRSAACHLKIKGLSMPKALLGLDLTLICFGAAGIMLNYAGSVRV